MAPLPPSLLRLRCVHLLAAPAVLGEERLHVPRIQQLDLDVRIELAEPAELAILAVGQRGLQRGDLDVEIEVGEIEVWSEVLGGPAILGPFEGKLARFVLPANASLGCANVTAGGGLTLVGMHPPHRSLQQAQRPRSSAPVPHPESL
jgi:hypothetical protein